MQKKLLLVFMVVNSMMVQASEPQEMLFGETQKRENGERTQSITDLAKVLADQEAILLKAALVEQELADYTQENTLLFKAALVAALSHNSDDIDSLFKANKDQYDLEEAKDKKEQDDSAVGFTGSYATPKSRNGIICQYFFNRKERKAAINLELQTKFNNYKKAFNEQVMPVLEKRVVDKNFTMENTYLEGFNKCGSERKCLRGEGISWAEITAPNQDDYFEQFCSTVYDPAMQIVREKGIPLTEEQIVTIAKQKKFKRGSSELSVKSLDELKKKAQIKVSDLLNPRKQEEVIFGTDVTEDQNDQGVLSQ